MLTDAVKVAGIVPLVLLNCSQEIRKRRKLWGKRGCYLANGRKRQRHFLQHLSGILPIQTCFTIDSELELAINELFEVGVIQIQPFPKTLKNLNELNHYHDDNSAKIPVMANAKYTVRIENLLKLLKAQLDSEK